MIRRAGEQGIAIEIDGQPDRLDLNDVWARPAKERGVSLVIDSDAHAVDQLDNMQYGVFVARRGWIEPGNVLNTLPLGTPLRRLRR